MEESRQTCSFQRVMMGHRRFGHRSPRGSKRQSGRSSTSTMGLSTSSFMFSSRVHEISQDQHSCPSTKSSLPQKNHCTFVSRLSKRKRTSNDMSTPRNHPWERLIRFLRVSRRSKAQEPVARSIVTTQPESSTSLATTASLCTFASKFEQLTSDNMKDDTVQALVDLPSLRDFDHGSISARRVYDFVWEYTLALTLAAAYQSRATRGSSSKRRLSPVNHPKWQAFWNNYHTRDFRAQQREGYEEGGECRLSQDHPEELQGLASWLLDNDIQDYAQDTLAVDTIKLVPGQDAAVVIFKTQQSYSYQEGVCSSSSSSARCLLALPRKQHTPLIHHEVDELVTWTAVVFQDDFTGNLQISSLRRTTQESTIMA